MTIPPNIIDEVRERVSLVELASERVPLKRSGKTYVGLCPFHSEKTPSFHVNEEEGLYHCFGCGKKGTLFNYVMETRGFSFPEAVRYLANRAGVKVPEERSQKREEREITQERSKDLRRVLRYALQVYCSALLQEPIGARCLEYVRERGVSREIVSRFCLGYAPDSWEFLAGRVHKLWGDAALPGNAAHVEKLLLEVGLLKPKPQRADREKERHYDAFRHRLIFPICRSDGSPIALGGRIIEKNDDAPKYINSSESLLYQKRKSFFGLHHALQEIRKRRHVILVEGYMDVMAMHQHGILNTVATCGTAVTAEHVRILRKITERVTIVFDGDASGRSAAAHCFEMFLNSGLTVNASLLPQGEDPDSLARKMSADNLQTLIHDRSENVARVFLEHLLGEAGRQVGQSGSTSPAEALTDPAANGKVAERYVALVAKITNSVERELSLRLGAELLGVSESSLSSLLRSSPSFFQGKEANAAGQPLRTSITRAPAQTQGAARGALSSSQRYLRQLLVAVLCEPSLAARLLESPPLAAGLQISAKTPESIRMFLSELSAAPVRGVSQWQFRLNEAGVDVPLEEFERDEALLISMLEKNVLPGKALIDEAVRQTLVGGNQPERVIHEAELVWSVQALSSDMENIRSEEKDADDNGLLQRLVQEKLEKKRHLGRLIAENR